MAKKHFKKSSGCLDHTFEDDYYDVAYKRDKLNTRSQTEFK